MTATAEERRLPYEVSRGRSHRVAELMLRFRELGIVLALVLVFVGTTIDNHRFASATSVQQLLSGASIIALLAIGETIVIVTRNVDLSIGSVVGISAYTTGSIFVAHPHVPIPVVLLAGIGVGAACGESTRPGPAGTRSPRSASRTASTRSATARSPACRTSG